VCARFLKVLSCSLYLVRILLFTVRFSLLPSNVACKSRQHTNSFISINPFPSKHAVCALIIKLLFTWEVVPRLLGSPIPNSNATKFCGKANLTKIKDEIRFDARVTSVRIVYTRCFIKRDSFCFFYNSVELWSICIKFLPNVAEEILIKIFQQNVAFVKYIFASRGVMLTS